MAPGLYWPVLVALWNRPDVIGQEASYTYPGIALGATKAYAWDGLRLRSSGPELAARYEHRDLATTADDRRIELTWEQPFTTGYWYRLLTETTKDGAGTRLAQVERSLCNAVGFDAPKTVKQCGLASPADCSVDKYEYNANGTLLNHTLPDNSS